jgi:hypothetical protein
MNKQPTEQESNWCRDLMDESDCGCVLIAHAMVDELLADMLRGHFTKVSGAPKKLLDDLLGSGQNKPLGSFASRVRVARALGLIDNDMFSCLIMLNDLRVRFAHYKAPRQIRLNSSQIADLFTKLPTKKQNAPTLFRKLFWGDEEDIEPLKHSLPRIDFICIATTLISLLEVQLVQQSENTAMQ